MRFLRTAVIARARRVDPKTGVGADAGVLALEAPSGFGKSWLIRQIVGPRASPVGPDLAELAELARAIGAGGGQAVVFDDAHLLTLDSVATVVRFIESCADLCRIVVSGRFLPPTLLAAVNLVDGSVFDVAALSIAADEVVEAAPELSDRIASRLVDAADGSVRLLATALDQQAADSVSDPLIVVHQMERTSSAATLQRLSSTDAELVGLLARASGVDRLLIDKLGGDGFVDRIVAAGVPLRRAIVGEIEVGFQAAFRAVSVDAGAAVRFANELLERSRPIEAVSLLLDAGAHDRAAAMLEGLPESNLDMVEPRSMLAVLARLGSVVDRSASLLLLRAAAARRAGRFERSAADLDRALDVVATNDGKLRRRLIVEHAERLWFDGQQQLAEDAANEALRELGPGEERTLATAHAVLADVASSADDRESLQRAADEYRSAIAAWEAAGEIARARRCRLNLASAVYVPLGRTDEALAQIGVLLATPDLSDVERTNLVLNEGFALFNANRLDAAAARFNRVGDIGQATDEPRLIATAAWGHALVSSKRDDASATMRWIGIAENTALGDDDDLLGVPFLCDVTTALGGLGEVEIARGYLRRLEERSALYPDQSARTRFLFEARTGVLGDVGSQLHRTYPADRWRVNLVAALAAARGGDDERARQLHAEADRELSVHGLPAYALLGERRAFEELQELLADEQPSSADDGHGHSTSATSELARRREGARVCVIGGSMRILTADGVADVPGGNPQRLVGIVVASGGMATFDQVADALWPGDAPDSSRARLRNVLLRLRKGAGDIVVRTASGVRLGSDVTYDLDDFERLADDALSVARADPDLAGHLAAEALHLADGPVLADFEYEEWAVDARRRVELKLLGLIDLLSVQAEDADNLALAVSLAERALRIDRYSDSRHVRLAELLTLQGRDAAAAAVLSDGAEAARELGAQPSPALKVRRDAMFRRLSGY